MQKNWYIYVSNLWTVNFLSLSKGLVFIFFSLLFLLSPIYRVISLCWISSLFPLRAIVSIHSRLEGLAVSLIVSNFGTHFKLIHWSTVCLAELISIQLVKKFSLFYWVRLFIFLFKRAQNSNVSWSTLTKSTSSHTSDFVVFRFWMLKVMMVSWSLTMVFIPSTKEQTGSTPNESSSFCGKWLIRAFQVYTWARTQIHFGKFVHCSEH